MEMKIIKVKYIALLAIIIGFTACNEPEDVLPESEMVEMVEPIALTSGSANFSTYVALGNSLTAGFTDNALFKAGQENSFPSKLAAKFAVVGGGAFSQPLTNDNIGGLLAGGTQRADPVGGAVRRLCQWRTDHVRPVHQLGREQMAAHVRPCLSDAPRV